MFSRISIPILVVLSTLHQGFCATLHLTGDSTMAIGGAGKGTQGWGAQLQSYMNINVTDHAVAGTSARSYTRQGLFTNVANQVQAGDFVVIEFGHNDGGGLKAVDNGKAECAGVGNETCQSTFNGVAETVYTFPKYLEMATSLMQSKGATVIISSTTPDNPCVGGIICTFGENRFAGMAQTAATASNVEYIDHQYHVNEAYKKIDAKTVATFFPNDHVHTSPAGATVVAESFLTGLMTGKSILKASVKSITSVKAVSSVKAVTKGCIPAKRALRFVA